MKRKLVIMNVALAALAVAAGWQLRARWLEGKRQEQRVLRQAAKPLGQPPSSPVRPPQPATAVSYGEVAQKMLFSPDRNPAVVEEVAAPKPVPPFPVFFGVMSLGSDPTLFFSEKPGAPSRGYAQGEKIGEFLLAEVGEDEVMLEWEGQQFRKKFFELKGTAPAEQPAAAPVAAPAPSAPAQVQTQAVSVSTEAGPGFEVTGNTKACVAGDNSPAGTVRDGYRKVLTSTPFGKACIWERIER